VLGDEVDIQSESQMIWGTRFRTAVVQALQSTALANERARLAAPGTARMPLVVLDAIPLQDLARIDSVRRCEN
jgi:hypothetical protein